MKLLLVLISITFAIEDYYLTLVNDYFFVEYDYNNIKLYSDKNIVKMNYEYISEGDCLNKQNIQFNYFLKESNNYQDFIKTIMKNDNIYYEINYETLIHNNYLDVKMHLKKYKTNNNNNIIICISFDRLSINYDGLYSMEVKDYLINFSNVAYYDNKYDFINIDRFSNYFYISIPSFNDYINYTFTIKYDNRPYF